MRANHHLVATVLCLLFTQLQAQSKLPSTSRTVFKCNIDGKVVYTDEPCVGAEKINAEPTRGMNQSTGTVKRGRDVQNEIYQETLANSLRPVTGMDPKQLATEGRRQQLPLETRRQCAKLDQDIARGEALERASGVDKAGVQQELFTNRVQYKRLGC